MKKKKYKIICEKCTWKWTTDSERILLTCPSCGSKAKNTFTKVVGKCQEKA